MLTLQKFYKGVQMSERVQNTLILMLIGLAFFLLFIFFAGNGGFAGNVDKNYFTSVTARIYDGDIKFSYGSNAQNPVLVNAKNIKVKIDSMLEGTAISATPKLGDRLYGESSRPDRFTYNARSVIVWVQNEEEKTTWENYIQKTIDKHIEYKAFSNRTRPKKVLP